MASRLNTEITHPETGETFRGSAYVYRDGVVISDVWAYRTGHCDTCNCADTRVVGGSFRGSIIRHARNRWIVQRVDGVVFPVVFRTRREAMRDTLGLAMDDYDLRAAGWS